MKKEILNLKLTSEMMEAINLYKQGKITEDEISGVAQAIILKAINRIK